MTHNRNLDSLRAAAALLVVAYHWQSVLPFGWMGVQFFFVLSGFLITGIILRDKEANVGFAPFVRRFFTRRALRLFPLYFGYLGLLSIAYLLVRQPIEFGDSAASLFTYTINFRETLPYFRGHRTYNHLWSLAVEWQFYLVWPFVVWRVPKRWLNRVLGGLVIAAPLVRLLTYEAALRTPWMVAYGLGWRALDAVYVLPWSHIDAFAIGALLCVPAIRTYLGTRRLPMVVCVLAVAIAGVFALRAGNDEYVRMSLGWPRRMSFAMQFVWGYTLLNCLSAVIIASVFHDNGFWVRITHSPVLHHLGMISYGIYVFHYPVTQLVGNALGRLQPSRGVTAGGLLLTYAITILIAHLSYVLWERRFLRLKERIKGRSLQSGPPIGVALAEEAGGAS